MRNAVLQVFGRAVLVAVRPGVDRAGSLYPVPA
ncbi:hypothetical protein C7453_11151 [Gluconacetobacter liquefaciens]|uniref:Uncharacterized protein n=1 Tax=Gluconacetobacter liquefaciens TaxID=89584 RepID=A0A370FX90_GLULI|nr:hypothetical protein C7453_11151 [Gluconacetobacter liquefaciens]